MYRLRIIVYGLFPTIFSACSGCCPTQYIVDCRYEEQIDEYPYAVKRNQDFLNSVFNVLSDFGDKVYIDVVGADSVRGLLLSIRYGLGSKPAIIIGDKVFKGEDIDLDEVGRYVSSLLDNASLNV